MSNATTEKKFNPKEIPSQIFDQFKKVTEQSPDAWVKMFQAFSRSYYNPITNNTYRGGNILSCFLDQLVNGYSDNRYTTFNAAKQLAAEQIEGYEMAEIRGRKTLVWKGEGEKPLIIDPTDLATKWTYVYFVWFKEVESKDLDENNQPRKVRIPYVSVHKVYNVELFKNLEIPTSETLVAKQFDVNNNEVELFRQMNNGPKFVQKLGASPKYKVYGDEVEMPLTEHFDNAAAFLSTLAHEYVHATGHKDRLNRKSLVNNGKDDYPKDELVAELGAMMFLGYFGKLEEVAANSANYIGGWIRRLSDFDENGKKHFMWAIGEAHKAFEYILAHQPIE